MKILVSPGGTARCIYAETIDVSALGRPEITRASHVEPRPDGRWTADMRPILGPVFGPFDRRSEALEAERTWLEQHWLLPVAPAQSIPTLFPSSFLIPETHSARCRRERAAEDLKLKEGNE